MTVHEAVAPDSATAEQPGTVEPLSVKPTLPPLGVGLTVAMKVTGWPTCAGLSDSDRLVAVGISTVTEKEPIALLPAGSDAVQLTVVVPGVKVLPETGEQEITRFAALSSGSVAVTP